VNTQLDNAGSNGRRFFQKWGLLLVVGLMLCGVWAFILSTLSTQKSSLLEERQRQLAQLNSAVAQQTAGLLNYIEMNLRVMDRYLQANPGIDPVRDPGFVGLVDMLRRSSIGLIDLRTISPKGDLYSIPSIDGRALMSIADRPHFTEQLRTTERKLYIGDPMRSRATGRWTIPVSWRLEAPVGNVLVVQATIELERLAALHERLRLKPAGTITLATTKGIVLSRTPYEQALVGKDLSPSPNYKNGYGVKPHGTFFTDNKITDGVARVASFERLEDYPVVVMVSEGMREVLQPYLERRDLTLALTGVVTLIILTLTFVLQRFLWAMHGAQAKLERRAAIDSLTATLRRSAFLEIARREFSRSQRYGRPAVLAVLDLDHFKAVNDGHGHAAGDTVLRECTAAWHSILREQDFLGRVGGEEFCALLPETDLESGRQVAERLREATAKLPFATERGAFSVTVSIGLTTIARFDMEVDQVLERADKALYNAKRDGRDRVALLEPRRLRAVSTRHTTPLTS
jgi:diguanylate cyclase (GGDEF)-like protein